MTLDPSSLPHEIDEQASLWAARLEGSDLSEARCAELDSWLAANPQHGEALASYGQFSADLEQRIPALFSSSEIASIEPVETTLAPRPNRWWWLGASLSAAASVVLVLSLTRSAAPATERIATAIAERQSIHLSDGTTVDLNAHTNLVFDTTDTERRIRMGGGQAFFAVTKDAGRPFIVDTPLGSVRVTGTAFDVSTLKDDAIVVTVAEGSVEVRLGESSIQSASAPFQLTARDQLSVAAGNANLRQLSQDQLEDETAWRDGFIVGNDMRLADVLVKFAHYHGQGLSAAPDVAGLSLSGRFPIADLDAFLLGLETIHPVRVIRDQSGTIRVVARD